MRIWSSIPSTVRLICVLSTVACGGSGANAPDASMPPPTPMHLTESELSRVVTYLASDELNGRDEGTPGGLAAREFLIAELERCGVTAAGENGFEQTITTGEGVNIVGRVEGSDPAMRNRHILLSAHYDHLGACGGAICNGADDNAAGVAIVLAVACELAVSPLPRSILVAFWDAEEPPTFLTPAMGSAFFVAHPVVPLEQIDVAIVLDLVGSDLWPGYGAHFVLGAELSPEVRGVVAAVGSPPGLLLRRASLHLVEETVAGHQPWSDYDAFRDASVPVLFLSNGQNKRYHTEDDEASLLDVPKMAREGAYLLSLVRPLGNAAVTPTFDVNGTAYATDAEELASVLEAAIADGGLIDSLGLTAASRRKLEVDLSNVRAIRGLLSADGQGELSPNEVRALRSAAQHVMCMAGSTYQESICNLF